MLDKLYTTKEAAKLLHRSPRTLETWRVKGNGPRFVKMGGKLCMYTEEALISFLDAGVRCSTSDKGVQNG